MSLRARTFTQLSLSGALLTLAVTAQPALAADRGHSVPLRIATYNIHAGAGSDGVFDLDRQAAALRALDADVIGLQEVDVHWGARSQGSTWPGSWPGGSACGCPSRRSTASTP